MKTKIGIFKMFAAVCAAALCLAGNAQAQGGPTYTVSFDLNGGKSNTIFSENFESNTHSFTLVNGSETNQWAVGEATAASGSKSAYISNDGGTSNNYNTSISSLVHIYRSVTFPESSEAYTLSFDWKGGDNYGYDYLRVYLVDASSSITAGSLPSGTLLGTYCNSSWQRGSVSIPASNSGTTKLLVFTWYNNDSYDYGYYPPAVDNIVLTSPVAIVPSIASVEEVLGNSTLEIEQKPSVSGITLPGYTNDGKWYIREGDEYKEFVFGTDGTPVTGNVTLCLKWTEAKFQFKVGITATRQTFYIPLNGYLNGSYTNKSYNWNIDWGDGGEIENKYGIQNSNGTGIPHLYEKSGDYTITITPAGSSDA
jgi:hypothetical protein